MVSSVVLTCTLVLVVLGMAAARVPHTTCRGNMYMCPSSGSCIPRTWLCDFDEDCPEAEDERGCPSDHQCPNGDFMCGGDGDCVPENWRCDEEQDCEDGSDERNCENYIRPQENEDDPNGQMPVRHANSHRGFHEHRLHNEDFADFNE